MLCVNLQTSFMHPPFGFALFYLRGIADTLYKEKRIPRPVLSNDIYLGAIPWVLMQLILVAIVIFIPQTVTVFLDKEVQVDLDKVKIEMPAEPTEQPTAPELAPGETQGERDTQNADEEQKKLDDLFKEKK